MGLGAVVIGKRSKGAVGTMVSRSCTTHAGRKLSISVARKCRDYKALHPGCLRTLSSYNALVSRFAGGDGSDDFVGLAGAHPQIGVWCTEVVQSWRVWDEHIVAIRASVAAALERGAPLNPSEV